MIINLQCTVSFFAKSKFGSQKKHVVSPFIVDQNMPSKKVRKFEPTFFCHYNPAVNCTQSVQLRKKKKTPRTIVIIMNHSYHKAYIEMGIDDYR